MIFGRVWPLVLSVTFAVACGENTGAPDNVPIRQDGTVHQVTLAQGGNARGFTITGGSQPGRAAAMTSPISTVDRTSFWAYTDHDASVSVAMIAADGTSQPYFTLVVPRGSIYRRPDGSTFALKDSVQISVAWDSVNLKMDLEPAGLTFNPLVPAQLVISYQGANPDFNSDGVVNPVDDYIGQVLLGLQTRESDSDPWAGIPSVNDVMNKVLSADLRHFTGYAISW